MARRMLAMGSVEGLRRRFGERLHVHLVLRGAPRTEEGEVERVREWVKGAFEGAEVEEKTYHGQMRFTVPVEDGGVEKGGEEIGTVGGTGSAIGRLVVLLEENKGVLGVEHYSVSPTTLDQVFLTVVGRHNVKEEGYEQKEVKGRWWRFGK